MVDDAQVAPYARNSGPKQGDAPLAVLLPESAEKVVALVKVAARCRVPLYPV